MNIKQIEKWKIIRKNGKEAFIYHNVSKYLLFNVIFIFIFGIIIEMKLIFLPYNNPVGIICVVAACCIGAYFGLPIGYEKKWNKKENEFKIYLDDEQNKKNNSM